MAGRKGQASANATSYGGVRGNIAPISRGGGDLPQTFKKRMQILATRAKTVATVEAILDDPTNKQFGRVWAEAMDRGFGKIPQPSTVDASVTLEVVMREEGARDGRG